MRKRFFSTSTSESENRFRSTTTTITEITSSSQSLTNRRASSYYSTDPLGERKLSEPPFQTDANVFQSPGYQSPYVRRTGPFASLRESTASSIQRPARLQPSPRTSRVDIASRVPQQSLPRTPRSTKIPEVPTYKTNGAPKAKVLIINIKKFLDNKEERLGSEVDLKELKKLFKDNMKFDVETHTDLKAKGIVQQIDKFRSQKSLQKADLIIVVLMSHGNNKINNGNVPGGFTQISGADGEAVVIDDILSKFTTDNCPGMQGKPKIFIFQCCRGKNEESLARDGLRHKPNQHGDMLIAYSTLPGFYSIRDPVKGSWYIQGICKVFKEHGHKHDVEALLKMVHEELNRYHPTYKQTSTYENRGFKTCYLW